MAQQTAGVTPPASPGLLQLFLAFAKIGLTSFGGGLSGWMLREFVQRRRWLDEGEFLSGLALAQAFPGVNVVNLSIWIGYRLGGSAGALVSALGMPLSTSSLLALIFSLSFSSSVASLGHFLNSSSVGSAFSLIFRNCLAKPSSDVPETRVVWKREVMDASCGFPGRRRKVLAALSRVRRSVQAEESV